METALRRVARWQEAWPRIADASPRDTAGRRPCYSFFYPEEEYQPELLEPLAHTFERSMAALGRYGLADAARQEHQTLSGGQKARLEILTLELAGHNVLLLDEPTDNLDVDSAVALEQALDRFIGTVIAVSHDRTFLRQLDRFLMISDDGDVISLPDFELAVTALADPTTAGSLRLAKVLT